MTSSLFFISKAIKEGPLKKKSPHKLGQTKWSNRYVVLYEDALVYYMSKDAAKPRGVVPLQYVITATAISDSEGAPPKAKPELPPNSRFEVAIRCTPSMKVFHWVASSEAEALAWVQEIKRVSEVVKIAQARDPHEAFRGPPSPRFWKDVVGLGVARARAAKEKAKAAADEKTPPSGVGVPRAPRSASAPHSGLPVARDSEDGGTPEEKRDFASAGEILYSPIVVGGVVKLGPLSPVPQTPVLVGVLSKRSPRGLRLWQRRYFSLFADLLIYSKAEGSPVLGAVPLECVESVSIIEITEGASLFNIVINHKGTTNPKTLEIMASTPQECTMWVEALHHACPNTMFHPRKTPHSRSRNSSLAGMVRSGSSGVIEFDLSTPYVDKNNPESPSKVPRSPPPPPMSPKELPSPLQDLTLANGPEKPPPPKPPPRKLSTYGSLSNLHTTTPPMLFTSIQENAIKPRASKSGSSPTAGSAPLSPTSPTRPPPPPPARKTLASAPGFSPLISPFSLVTPLTTASTTTTATAATIIDDIFPSPFTPVAAPIFAPAKNKAPEPVAPQQEAVRVAPVLTSAALPDPMDEAPPDYTSSSDSDSDFCPRESVNFAAICTPESITTVTTYYRHKTTDSSDSEDYVLIDLDGAEDDGDKLEEKLPAFLPQSVPVNRKPSASSWTAIHHNPAEYSPKLVTTKLSPDTIEKDLVLSVGPSRWRSVSQKDGSPPPRSSTPPTNTPTLVPLAPSDYPASILYHVDAKTRSLPKAAPPPPRPLPMYPDVPSPRLTSASSNIDLSRPEILKPGESQKGKDGIVIGDYVELGGLVSSKYNSQKGVVLFTEAGRCEIRLASGDVVRIKEVNLKKVPKPKVTNQPRFSASNGDLHAFERSRDSSSGSGSGSARSMARCQSSSNLRSEVKAQASRLPAKPSKVGDHKRALSSPPKPTKVIPTDVDVPEVPKPFLADEDGTGTEDDDTEDEQLASVQSAPEWVKNRLYSAEILEKPASKSASKMGAMKDKLLKR